MKISVFITSYNQRDYLKEAIDSVLAQTVPAAQIIVADDASSDGSQDLIADYYRSYPELFTPIYHTINTGVAQIRVDALKAVRGDYVTYVDGDDWFLPEKLELESKALESAPETRIAFSNNEYVSEDGNTFLRKWADGEEVPRGEVFWQTFSRTFPRRDLFRMELVHYDSWCRVGFHDPKMRLYEDFDMRIRLSKKLKVTYVDCVLSRIRSHQRGLSHLNLEQHFNALNYLFHKNIHLLNSLPAEQRRRAISGFKGWITPIGKMAAQKAFQSGSILDAAKMRLKTLRFQVL